MSILQLDLDEVVAEHVARHRVEVDEIEDICFGPHFERTGRDGRLIALGITSAGRCIVVVLSHLGAGTYRPVTARDMTWAEKAHTRARLE